MTSNNWKPGYSWKEDELNAKTLLKLAIKSTVCQAAQDMLAVTVCGSDD